MFDDIGVKIKSLASVIGIGGALIFALIAMIGFSYDPTYLLFLLLAVISIVSSWPLYGFGQLIESTMSIEKMLKSSDLHKNLLTNKVQSSEKKDIVEKDIEEDTVLKSTPIQVGPNTKVSGVTIRRMEKVHLL